MARLFFGMNQSLDGYVDHDRFAPGPALFEHFIAQTAGLAGSLYGRRLYELMHYWDDERAEDSEAERAFAAAWRQVPKWVVSRTLTALGPNATLIDGDLETAVRRLKDEQAGEIEVGGPVLAQRLTELGLIDEYRIYLHPVVLGEGVPFFRGTRPPLKLKSCERIAGDDDVLKLVYVPA